MIKLINSGILILSLLLSFPISTSAQETETVPISLEEALKRAPIEDKKILLDVYASWCPYCQRMHSDVYTSDEVIEAISSHYLWVKINVESDELVNYHGQVMTEAEFVQALENKNIPTTYFLNDEGAIIGVQPGFLDVDVFSNLLNFVGSDAFMNQSFDDYLNQN